MSKDDPVKLHRLVASVCAVGCLLLLTGVSAEAGDRSAKFQHLTIEDGLSQSTVLCMLQDSRGFIWFGTQDGLNRYDGNSFVIYRNDLDDSRSLSSNSILSLAEDADGNIWVGTENEGLNRYSRNSDDFTRFTGIQDESTCLLVDRDGMVWAASSTTGLVGLDPTDYSVRRFNHDPADSTTLSDDSVWCLASDGPGVLWVGTNNGLCRLNTYDGSIRRIYHDEADSTSLTSDSIYCLSPGADGDLWVGTYDGLNRYDPEQDCFKRFVYDKENPNSISGRSIFSVAADSSGTIWVGTAGSGLNQIDPVTEEVVRYEHDPRNADTLGGDSIVALLADDSGITWAATGADVSRLDLYRKPFDHFFHQPGDTLGLCDNTIWSFDEDSRGRIWIATANGLSCFDCETGSFETYRSARNDSTTLDYNDLSSVHVLDSGEILVGSAQGVLDRLDPETGVFTHLRPDADDPTGLTSNRVFWICGNRDGGVWLATDDGLVLYDETSQDFTRFANDPENSSSLSMNMLGYVYQDPQGQVWAAGWSGGLDRLDPSTGHLTHFDHDPETPGSLSNNSVNWVFQDSRGWLWVGTGNGLNGMAPGSDSFTVLTTNDGLSNNYVYTIAEDDEGNLWITTNYGLSRFDPLTRVFDNFDAADGLQSNEFNSGACYLSSAGLLYFGGLNGYNVFDPREIRNNPIAPRVVITDFLLFNKSVAIGADYRDRVLLDRSITETDVLELSYRDYVISFEFSAIHFANPGANRYAYMLENFETDWNFVETHHRATYTNLPSGDYVFRVKAANSDGVWNEEGTSLAISVAPPYWENTWFIVAVLLAGLGVVLAAHTYRTQLLRIRAKSLQRRVADRTAELQDVNRSLQEEIGVRHRVEQALRGAKEDAESAARAKSEFLANISHEIRTPLNGVIGMTTILKSTRLDQQQEEYCRVAETNAHALLSLVNDVLDFSKIEAGKLEMSREIFDLRDTVTDIGEMLAMASTEKGLDFACVVDSDVPARVQGDPVRLRQILLNLVNNAVKFTESGSVCTRVNVADTSSDGIRLRFEIQDTGKGIPEDRQHELFRPFSQIDGSKTRRHGGTGLGLAIVKQLVDLMDGEVGVRSTEGGGATFWFTAEFPTAWQAGEQEVTLEKKGKVLVVDRFDGTLESISKFLVFGGYEPVAVTDSIAAMAALHRDFREDCPFDAVVVGSLPSDEDVVVLGGKISAKTEFNKLPMVLICRMDSGIDAQLAADTGYARMLQAPAKSSRLLEAMRAVLSETPVGEEVETETRQDVPAGLRGRVLVAEDNKFNQRVAQLFLQKMGYEVELVDNGRDAVERLSEASFDVILMDVQMPVMDGMEAARLVRDPGSSVLDHDIPIIALTAHAMTSDRQQCMDAGMNEYLTKPIDGELLEKTLERLIAGVAI